MTAPTLPQHEADTAWSAVSGGWSDLREHVETTKAALTERMLEVLALQPGQHVVELGCGTGELARRLADQVGPTGRVTATDVAAGMREVARATLADLPEVEVQAADAADTGLASAWADAVVFRMGPMLVQDPVAVAQEARRVLRPGGTYLASVWAGPAENPWLSSVGMAAAMAGIVQGGPPVGPGGIFSLADPEVFAQTATDGGFTDVEVEEVQLAFAVRDHDHHLQVVSSLAGPLAAALRAATGEQLATLHTTIEQLTAQYAGDAGLVLPAKALLLRAR